MSLKIMLVEDEPHWQEGIKAFLSLKPDWKLVSITDNFEAAVNAYQTHQPNIILLDWNIKGEKDGLDVAEELHLLGVPEDHMIIVSGSDPSVIPTNPYHYVPKQSVSTKLIATIEAIQEKASFKSPNQT
ncbi:MAG: response regulator [Cyanobacteria bacterium]|nr:response regulator [Cyanobacteriota bacterium]